MVAALTFVLATTHASAADVCYQLPFSNPNLADGWGSTKGRSNPHRGVDFPQAANTPIPAVADGVVRVITSTPCLGNVIVLEHADGMFSGYAHLIRRSPLAIGNVVKRGQTIANVGTTGTCTTGNHLHLTLSASVNGYYTGTTVDPYKYIQAHKVCTPVDPRKQFTAGVLTFSNAGPVAGKTCVKLDEPADPHGWADNFLCSEGDLGLAWSHAGPIAGLRCTNVGETAEHDPKIWADNFVCLPTSSPWQLAWSTAGPLPQKDCVQWYEGSDLGGSWGDNFLCAERTASAGTPATPPASTGAAGGANAPSAADSPSPPDVLEDDAGGCSVPKSSTPAGSLALVAVVALLVRARRRR